MATVVQGAPPEGQWYTVMARDLKGRVVFVANKERYKEDADKLAAAWARKVEIATVEVGTW